MGTCCRALGCAGRPCQVTCPTSTCCGVDVMTGVLVGVLVIVGVEVMVGVFVAEGVGVLVAHRGWVKCNSRPPVRPPVLHSYWVNREPVSLCTPTVAPVPELGT